MTAMKRITRRRLLASGAAASIPVSAPTGKLATDDAALVQDLISAHRGALIRWNNLPAGLGDIDEPIMEEVGDELDRTAEALCLYRPSSLAGVHAKARYMYGCEDFTTVETENFLSRADLLSGFLPAGGAS